MDDYANLSSKMSIQVAVEKYVKGPLSLDLHSSFTFFVQ